MEVFDGFVGLFQLHVAHSKLIGELRIVVCLLIRYVVVLDCLLVLPQREVVGPDIEVGENMVVLDLKT